MSKCHRNRAAEYKDKENGKLMDEIQELLEKKMKDYDKLIEQIENWLRAAPEGKLRIVRKAKTDQYYLRKDPKNFSGVYLKKCESQLVRNLAQKDYFRKLLPELIMSRRGIKKAAAFYRPDKEISVYETLPETRKKLVSPVSISDEDYAVLWKQKKQQEAELLRGRKASFSVGDDLCSGQNKKQNNNDGNLQHTVPNQENAIFTENGEIVRSKSEKIIADKLKLMGVCYLYEPALDLSGYGYVKPDFIVLNIRTRKEYYWEHLGMMEQTEYCEKAIKKIELYEKNGIYPGKQLILTFETNEHMLNIRVLEKLIREFLL